MSQSAALTQLTGALLSSRNADGGWGYHRGKASRLEPTCWAILTLLQAGQPRDGWEPGASFHLFEQWQHDSGLLADQPGQPPNLAFNGLAALAALQGERRVPGQTARLTRVRDALLSGIRSVAGVRLPNSPVNREDCTLQGWPWIDRTFSWVEPTGTCLLALKKALSVAPGADSATRIEESERFLFDRACRDGGWNFGTPDVLGVFLDAYVPTTALALLALQDHMAHPVVVSGIEFLARHRVSEASGMALGLAAIALRVYQRPVGDVESRLVQVVPTTLSIGDLANTAIAAFALAGGERGVEPFVL
jgi:hypothetical protein